MIYGGQWIWTERGWALQFDGVDDYVTLVDDPLDMGTSDFSIVFRIKTSYTPSTTMDMILYKGAHGNVGYKVAYTNNNTIRLTIQDSSGYASLPTTTTFNDGEWHHVAFSIDRDGTSYVYVDGVLDNSGDLTAINGSIDNSITAIVGSLGGTDRFLNGILDELRIYNRALSESEIQQLYNGENVSGGLVLYLPFNRMGIKSAHFVDYAAGKNLEYLGELLNTRRLSGETDEHYRARLKAQFRQYTSSATVKELKEIISTVLSTQTDRATIKETWDTEPASFDVWVFLQDLEAAGITVDEFKDILDSVKPAGVRLTAKKWGTFECKSAGEPSDATKGYNDLANSNPDGGTYAGLL
jgi:hypothetical protein